MSKPKNTVSDVLEATSLSGHLLSSFGQISLLQHLDLPQVNCLNESIEHPIRAILSSKSRNSSDDFLESDADEQMLLNIYVSALGCSEFFVCSLNGLDNVDSLTRKSE